MGENRLMLRTYESNKNICNWLPASLNKTAVSNLGNERCCGLGRFFFTIIKKWLIKENNEKFELENPKRMLRQSQISAMIDTKP